MKKIRKIILVIILGLILSGFKNTSEPQTPADYELSKVAALNIDGLAAKKSLNPVALMRLMQGYIDKTIARERNLHDTIRDYQPYLDSALILFGKIESARQQAERLVGSAGYLPKIQAEFHCSPAVALEHQRVRVANIDISNYRFVSSQEMESFNEESVGSVAYAIRGTNEILFVYTADSGEENIYTTALHEFLHKATNSQAGLSDITTSLLSTWSFRTYRAPAQISAQDSSHVQEMLAYSDYCSAAEERYVRFKILESELEKFGIKELGESFTLIHYERMMQLFTLEEIDSGAGWFIYFTKGYDSPYGYQYFKKLFTSIG